MSPVNTFSETSTVQAAIVERLAQSDLGWSHIRGDHLDRGLETVLLEADLVSALIKLNPLIAEDPARVDEVVPRLRAVLLSALNEGLVAANEQMVTWLRGNQTHKFIGTDGYEQIHLIDFDNPRANRLVVSDEVTFGAPGHERRFDLVLWVNGFPLVVGETKTPVNASVSWLNAAKDSTTSTRSSTPVLRAERAVVRHRGPGVPLRSGGPASREMADVGQHDRSLRP